MHGWECTNGTLRLSVGLIGIRCPFSRIVDVPDTITLGTLHDVLQIVMGWKCLREHSFSFDVGRYTNDVEDRFIDWRLESGVTLVTALGAGARFLYYYGNRANWRHRVVVFDRVVSDIVTANRVFCRHAVGPCPPEDCCGPEDYAPIRAAHRRANKVDIHDVNRRLEDFARSVVNAAFDRAAEPIGLCSRAECPSRFRERLETWRRLKAPLGS